MSCSQLHDTNGNLAGHIMIGGPDYEIEINGEVRVFEDHYYCGPTLLQKRTGDPIAEYSKAFRDAIERWFLGGKQVDYCRCVVPDWCSECNGDGFNVVGKFAVECPKCNGKKIQETT